MKKSRIHLTLKCFLLFALLFMVHCQPFSSPEKAPILLTLWVTYQGPEIKKFQEILRRFEKEYPQKYGKEIRVEAKQVPFDDLVTNIKMACISGRTPDIARVDVMKMVELAYHKVIVPLDQLESFDASSIQEKKKEFLSVPFQTNVIEVKNQKGDWENHLYGLPEQTTCLALFWNRKLFREREEALRKAGLNPNCAPKNWEELIRYGKVLTQPEKGLYGFAMNNSLWWTMPFFGLFGGSFIQKDKQGRKVCPLGDERTKAALQLKVDLYRRHKIEAGAWKSGALGPDVSFLNEKVAMIFMGPWMVERFLKKGLDFGISLIPPITQKMAQKAGLKKIPPSATNIGGNNLVIFESCRHKDAAYRLLKFITSTEVQLDWCLSLKQIPVNRKALQILLGQLPYSGDGDRTIEVDPYLKVFMHQIEYAMVPPQIPRYGYIESDIMNPEMELALKGKKTVEQALKDGARRINQEILSKVNE